MALSRRLNPPEADQGRQTLPSIPLHIHISARHVSADGVAALLNCPLAVTRDSSGRSLAHVETDFQDYASAKASQEC